MMMSKASQKMRSLIAILFRSGRGVKLLALVVGVMALDVSMLPRELRLGPSEQDALQMRPMFARAVSRESHSGTQSAGIADPYVSPRARGDDGAHPTLTLEQRSVAAFIADKYRLDIDQTQDMVRLAYQAGRQVRVDPLLVLAVISVESGFNPNAQSRRGAQGLMQVRTRVHAERFEPFGGRVAAFDPWANIHVGSSILKEYLRREGSVEGALKSYVGAAQRPDDGGYAAKVLSERDRLAAAARGGSPLAGRTKGAGKTIDG